MITFFLNLIYVRFHELVNSFCVEIYFQIHSICYFHTSFYFAIYAVCYFSIYCKDCVRLAFNANTKHPKI